MQMTTFETLAAIQAEIMPDSLPAADRDIRRVEKAMLEAIERAGIVDDIDPGDLDELTENNFHTVRRAAELALKRHGRRAEQWLVFYGPSGDKLGGYTLEGSFPGEYENMLELLAHDHGIKPDSITTEIITKIVEGQEDGAVKGV